MFNPAEALQQARDTDHSFMITNAFYTACLLKQMQGVDWSVDSVLKEVLEQRKLIVNAL